MFLGFAVLIAVVSVGNYVCSCVCYAVRIVDARGGAHACGVTGAGEPTVHSTGDQLRRYRLLSDVRRLLVCDWYPSCGGAHCRVSGRATETFFETIPLGANISIIPALEDTFDVRTALAQLLLCCERP